MRYINKEYGFTFRPPFFNSFSEEFNEGPNLTNKNFPNRNIIGAGYDYTALNGAMLVSEFGALWGVKVSYHTQSGWLEQEHLIHDMNIDCAYSRDGTFAHFAHGPLNVKWLKHNDRSLIFKVSSQKKLRVRITFYACYDWMAEFSVEDFFVKGRAPYVGILPGVIDFNDENVIYKGRFKAVNNSGREKEYFMTKFFSKPLRILSKNNESVLEYMLNKNQSEIYFYSCVGNESIFSQEIPSEEKIKNMIDNKELRYAVSKVKGYGLLGENAIRIVNGSLWSKIYFPYLLDTIFTSSRNTLDNHFALEGVSENCAAIMGALAGAYNNNIQKQLEFTLQDKIMGPLAVWQIFCIMEDKNLLYDAYKSLCKLYEPNSFLINTTSQDKIEVAYKWHDSPLKELNRKGVMLSLDLSCLKLLAFDILERLSIFFEEDAYYQQYKQAKEELKQQINDILWDEKRGAYSDKYQTGNFSYHVGATLFYPLIAGAVEDPQKLASLIEKLMGEFWGEYCIPTLSKKSMEFGEYGKPSNNGIRQKPYLEYRGSIIPYVNYLIYLGLVRCGLDEIAGMCAQKSVKLWNKSRKNANKSFYLPNGKSPNKAEYLSSSSNLLLLIGLMELIDVEYFREDLEFAIRFGTFVEGTHMIDNYAIKDNIYSLHVDDKETTLLINKKLIFNAFGGKCKVRNFIITSDYCSFDIDSHGILDVSVYLHDGVKNEERKYHMNLSIGKKHVEIAYEKVNSYSIDKEN